MLIILSLKQFYIIGLINCFAYIGITLEFNTEWFRFRECSHLYNDGGPEKGRLLWNEVGLTLRSNLTAETVQGTALAFQSVDDVHGGDGLPLGVLGVGDGITDHVFQENL